jgi:hypothetical protein
MKTKKRKTELYIFHRGNLWYPIELYDDKDAIENAIHNVGTTKVENAKGKIIWELKENQRDPAA